MGERPAEPKLPARARDTDGTDSGRNATGLAAVWKRLETTEELLVTQGAGLSVTQALMDRYGVTRRQARALQAAVRMRWARESASEGRAQRIERYRRTLEQVIKQGFDRKITVCTNRKEDEYEVVPQPDLKAVTAATALLVRMDGADQPEPTPALPAGGAQPAGEQVVLTGEEAEAEMMRRRDEGER